MQNLNDSNLLFFIYFIKNLFKDIIKKKALITIKMIIQIFQKKNMEK